ncbi:kelch-like protein 25 [Arctopsyche grandis]|uniref:kelch-like protein 25 n=1 Tax=Arctopsyche grandis TaxID=121162 RepID=UPI00406D8965
MFEAKTNPGFANSLMHHMYNSMKQQQHADVIFAVRNRSIFAHMVVLSASSDFFKDNQYLLSDIFSGFDDEVIDAVLKYLYTGEITIDDGRLDKFKNLANLLKIKNVNSVPVPRRVPEFHTIDLSNCLQVLRSSPIDATSKKSAMNLAAENFGILHRTPDFLLLPASVLAELLKLDELNVPLEEDVFKAVKLWINHDFEGRKTHLSQLLGCVRLTLLPMQFLTTEVLPFCTLCPECIVMVSQAMQVLMTPNSDKKDKPRVHLNLNASKLLIVGCWDDVSRNFIEIYNPENNVWTKSRDYGFNRRNFCAAKVDDRIMVIGGFANGKGSNNVDCVNLKNGQKSAMTPLNQGRFNAACATITNGSSTDVYIIGGANPALVASVEKWNSNTQTWSTNIANMPLAVHAHSAAVVNNKIYVTGGSTKGSSVTNVQMYTPESNSWAYCAAMTRKRFCHLSAGINGKVFVVGGCEKYFIPHTVTASVESYDPNSNLWTPFCNLPSPRTGSNMCLYRNKFIFVGGKSPGGLLNQMLEYDDEKQTWTHLKGSNISREGIYPFVVSADAVI